MLRGGTLKGISSWRVTEEGEARRKEILGIFAEMPGSVHHQVELFFSLLQAVGRGWPFIPPVDPPADYLARDRLVLIRKRIDHAARDILSQTRELNFVLPSSP